MDRKPNHDLRGRPYAGTLAERAERAIDIVNRLTSERRTTRLSIPAGDLLHSTPCGDEDMYLNDTIRDLLHALQAGDGLALICAERKRQVEQEGWTPEHDDEHDSDELALAAACYALPERERTPGSSPTPYWPWIDECWKPTSNDRVRELVKAGALIAAEIDRLLRSDARTSTTPGAPQ